MTARGRALLLVALGTLYSGMSLGGRMFYLSAVFALLALLCGAVTALLFRARLRIRCEVSPAQTPRGEMAHLRVRVDRAPLLPVSPLQCTVALGELRAEYTLPLRHGGAELKLDIPARHIGQMQAGVSQAALSDALGLFRVQVPCRDTLRPLLVLPRSFEVSPLRFLSADEGRPLPNRTSEDLSSPEDTRPYRPGDALKRVHWKLSARKRDLVSRTFEIPAPPDTLILLDCTAPAADESAAALRRCRWRRCRQRRTRRCACRCTAPRRANF